MPASQTALKVFGAVFMLRALVGTFHPTTLGSMINYPPPAKEEKAFLGGSKMTEVVDVAEQKQVMMITQFYSLSQVGLSGIAITAARAGDPYSMSIASVGLGVFTLMFCAYGYFALSSLTDTLCFEMKAIVRMIVPYSLIAIYLIYSGMPGLSAKPASQSIGKSGTVMAICSIFGLLQGLPLIFFTDAWLANFSLGVEMHPTSRGVIMSLAPMWGICIAGGAAVRLALIRAGHTASIYAANRSLSVYYAMLVGALAMAKSQGSFSGTAITVQCYAAFVYFGLTYFGGVVADSAEPASAPKKKK